jgi:Acetoacetate decarboxylase (ADC)
MPTCFGPFPGPRQRPDGGRWEVASRRTTIWVAYRADPVRLAALLPAGFEVDAGPVSVEVAHLEGVGWLAGRGYSMVSVYWPVRFRGRRDDVRGRFCAVMWENLADPIISGREEVGHPKLYAEIPDIRLDLEVGTAAVSATWDGLRFLDLAVRDLIEAPATTVEQQPLLYLKYVPRTGEWGTADACYVTLTPAESAAGRVLRRWDGLGSVAFHSATFEQLPTLFHVVNALAGLQPLEIVGAGVQETVGGGDCRDQRILE